MVQHFGTLEDPRERLTEMMGMSLGQGIGNGLSTYFANRSLESVLKDKSLEGAPSSKRLQALYTALAPYGEKGQEILQQRIQLDQMETQKQKSNVIGKYFNGQALTPDEQALLSPEEFVAMYKAKNPSVKGGVTSQPIPPEINEKISHVINQSQGMTADELKNVMDTAGIPPIYSNGYIENRRRTQETGTEHDIKFHQESSDFEKSLRNHANTARRQLPLIENSIKSVSEGKIKPNSLANVFTFFGETGRKIGNALLSGDQAAILASVPEFLEGRKELFGVRLSDADLRLLQDKLPDIGKSKEANMAILKLMKKSAERALKLEKVGEDVLQKKGLPYRGGKLRPLGYEGEVMKAFEEFEGNEGWLDKLPDAASATGKVIEDESGKRWRSDGNTWEPI